MAVTRIPIPAWARTQKADDRLELSLSEIDLPVRIVVGQRDPVKRMYVTPIDGFRKDWPVVEIEGAGHIDCIMKEPFKTAVVQWVAKYSAHPKP